MFWLRSTCSFYYHKKYVPNALFLRFCFLLLLKKKDLNNFSQFSRYSVVSLASCRFYSIARSTYSLIDLETRYQLTPKHLPYIIHISWDSVFTLKRTSLSSISSSSSSTSISIRPCNISCKSPFSKYSSSSLNYCLFAGIFFDGNEKSLL